MGSITQAQATAAAAEKLTYYTWEQYLPPTVINGANTSSFLDYLTTYYLPALFQGDTFSNPGGYDIYTTLNLKDQALGDATVHSVITSNPQWFVQGAAGGDGALVSLDPQTGAVLAMTGSANYSSTVYGQDNLAIDERQPGSTMKLFTYTDAIASRQYTMTTQISDETMTLDGWTPKDYEGSPPVWASARSSTAWATRSTCRRSGPNTRWACSPSPTWPSTRGSACSRARTSPIDHQYSFTLGTFSRSARSTWPTAPPPSPTSGVHHAPAPVVKITNAATGATVWSYNAAGQRHAGGPGERRLRHGRDAEQWTTFASPSSATTRS